MARPPLSLPLLLLLSVFSLLSAIPTSTAKSPASHPADFIWSSCRTTRYPSLCYHCLSSYASQVQRSERRLAMTALSVSLGRARSAAQYVSRMRRAGGMSHREYEAVRDCIETMGDSVEQLGRSIRELGHMGRSGGQGFLWHMSNVQTWVSAALTNENTCVDGFSGRAVSSKVRAAVRTRVTGVAQVTSNALALVNRVASRHKTVRNNAESYP